MWRQLSTFAFASGLIMASALWLVSWGSRRLRANVRAAEERRRYLAVHDALTGLTNRDAFQGLLQRWIDAQASGGAGFALLFIDVDSFKRINDTFGHSAGDALLQTVAKRLRARVRATDVVARIGGDEFAILLAAPATAETAGRVASAILREIPQPFDFQGDKVAASVSIGVALYPRDATSGETLLQCADAAMYHAKRLGKNAFEFFSAQIADTLAAQRQLEQDLRGAIDAGQLWLAYQPVFDVHLRIVSVEALVRWNHPQHGTVPPSQFVPAAEACGLMPELGREIVRIAGRDLQWWRDQGIAPPRVAVNLSSRQFVRDHHGSEFVAMLEALALSPKDISFELTEGAVFEDLDSPGSVIAQLQQRGYQLALDDFGTGYSSLAYLLRLRCDILKIDRVFVHGSAASKESTLLVAAMVHVAHALGMQVIAEGVEKDEDLAHVQRLGCDAVQGFLLSAPVRREGIEQLLQEQRANESVAV
jgi:diguanylate cyclase (GGDEF)-like protein